MGKIAFVFSGQGAQYSGMGKALYASSPAAKAVFDMADSLRPGTARQCFEGSMEELTQTVNTQPCVFAVDLAAARALAERGIQPDCVAGFSLGEIAALAFAGVLSDEEAFRLVCKRGELMDKAARENPGAMVAVLKLTSAQTEELCQRFEKTYPVNSRQPAAKPRCCPSAARSTHRLWRTRRQVWQNICKASPLTNQKSPSIPTTPRSPMQATAGSLCAHRLKIRSDGRR